MSNDAISWAFKQDLPMTEKFVLVALADYADENNMCFPSHKKTAGRIGASPDTVKRATKKLSEKGYLDIVPWHRPNGSTTSNRYRLKVGVQIAPPVADATPEGYVNAGEARCTSAPPINHQLIPQSEPSVLGAANADARSEVVPAKTDDPLWKAVAKAAYDGTDGALGYMAMYKIAEWAISKKGCSPDDVNNAIQTLWNGNRAVTRQTVGQYLDGITASNAKQSPAERLAGTATLGQKLQAEADRRAINA